MTENEIEMALESLFVGAAKVREKKQATTISKNVHKQFPARITSQMWKSERRKLKII